MQYIKHLLVIELILLTNMLFSQSNSAKLSVDEIVQRIDELYRSKSSYALMEMEIITPHWERKLKMKIWTEGMDKTFIRILEPPKEKGVATLRIENEMWNYLPKTNKVMKIPPSMMMSSWMGSDFNNNDLVSEFSLFEDYHYKFSTVEDPQEDLYYIEAIPKEGVPIVWGKIVVALRKSDYIPVWEKYYDNKDNLMRLMNFKQIEKIGGRKIPRIMELIPKNEKGNKTVLRYLEAEFNIQLQEDIFSLRNLRSY